MKRFLNMYFRQRVGVLLLFILSCGVFLLVFALYDLPVGAALYPALICAVFWFLYAIWDIRRAWSRHQTLTKIRSMTAALMEDVFPRPRTIGEADYQAVIRRLRQEQMAMQADTRRRYNDQLDYYTLWAHQIKTPIASMRLTLQNEDSPTARRLMLDLGRIERYVEMVLVFLRLDADAPDYVLRDCDLDGIIRGVVKKFAGEFIDRKLRLCYEPLNAAVLTDEKWLAFVIEQVLSNALKYTPSGSIAITLEPDQTLVISDTGIGIAPGDLPRIFEQGFTGANGRMDKRASGLGLYL